MPGKPGSAAPSYTNALSINRLSVDVHLGVGKEERQTPQKIILDVRFYMPSLMSSATRDNGEYICYHDISEKIYALCVSKEYHLIEYLAQEVYRLIRKEMPAAVKLWIRLHKPRILLPYVEEGASFTYTDLPPFSWIVPD
jgi:FolB domain-containing protein